MPHVLTVIGIVLGWGDFFPPTTRVIKDPPKKKKNYWLHGNENTLIIHFFFQEREKDKAFNFQAFKVIVSSISISCKTNVFKTASIMANEGKKVGAGGQA